MKRRKIIILLTTLMCMVGAKASAHDIAVKNAYGTYIYYTWQNNNTELAVCYGGSNYYSSQTYSGNVVIPESVTYNGNTYRVTSIGSYAFFLCSGLTSVSIPNSVTKIEYDAFYGCTALTSVTIPNSVTSIGGSVFGSCSSLVTVTIPNCVTTIEYSAFKGCSALTSITIPNSVTSIGISAFEGCSSLTSITIPYSVTRIEYSAFEGCSGLESINVNSGNPTYDSRNNCKAIIETSSNKLIVGCQNTVIPNTVTSIGDKAFYGCSELTSITIPNSVTSIGYAAFRSCSNMTSVTIPNSVTSIGGSAFQNCSSLTFVTIPNSVSNIDTYTFYGCSNLSRVISEIMNPFAFGSSAFTEISPVCTLTVPAGTKGNYIKAGWTSNVFKGGIIDLSEPEIIDVSRGSCITAKSIEGVDIRYMVTDISQRTIQVGLSTPEEYWQGSKTAVNNNTSGSVTIPDKVFYGGIEYSVTYIANSAFYKCSNLTDITIPESVTHIGHAAFEECSSLTSINIPNSVTSIDDGYAFYGCSNLTSVHISENLKELPNDTFAKCSSLTSVTIPEGVTNVGKNVTGGTDGGSGDAFWDCSGLTTVIIPSSVTYFVGNSFSGCNNLTTVVVQRAEPVSISSRSFSNRKHATLYVPYGSKAAYEAADYWKEFKEIVEMAAPVANITFADANVKALCVANWDTNGDGELSEAEAAAVTSLGTVFERKTAIVSFDELQYFTGLTSIGDCAFYGCSGLTSVTIPNTVTNIDYAAFYGCSSLTSVTIPNSVTSISDDAFRDCSSLTSVTIPNSVTNIGYAAFCGCSDLTSVTIPNSVTNIGDWVFYGCSGLTSVTLPNSVASIGEFAFRECSSLTSMTVPNSVTSIGDAAFYGCSDLVSVAIPNSVTSIGDDAFYDCSSLTSVIIPNSVTSISDGAFCGCSSLTSVTIPNSVTSIGECAFEHCSSLTSITIPSSVTSIGEGAFEHCPNLTSVTVLMETPVSISAYTFYNRKNSVLYVPAGCKAAYEAADYWKEFKQIVELVDVTDVSQIDNVIYIEPTEGRTGSEATISFKMKNTAAIRGFQFDLVLPDGVTPVEDGGEYVYWLNADRTPKKAGGQFYHTLEVTKQADGSYRFLCGAQADKTFTGSDGEVAVLKVNIADDMLEGEYPVILKNIKLTETDISNFYQTDEVVTKLTIVKYVPGDISGDGIVDVSDYIGVANHILGNTPAGFNARAADVNNDNVIDVSDYIGIANIILTGSIYGNSNANARTVVQEKEPQ